jgi:hypothetical protein
LAEAAFLAEGSRVSIQPPSDIVLDVAQAADPVKSVAAAQKLLRASSPDGSETAFSNVLENVTAPLDNTAGLKTQLGMMNPRASIKQTGNAEDMRTKAYQGLEALVFQNLFETTLPHDSSLGSGMAGDVWRSMMAEQLGKQTAKMIDLGLFPKAEGAHTSQSSRSVPQKAIADPPLPVSDTVIGGSSS